MSEREMVKQFHEAMGLPVRERPEMPSEAERLLRCRLLLEETMEYIHASGCSALVSGTMNGFLTGAVIRATHEPDLAAMAQENADVRIITLGSDLTMGSPPDVCAEVVRANMSKLGDDGKPVLRADGKVTKGPNYRPPDVKGVLARATLAHLDAPCSCAFCASGEPR